MVVKFIVGWAGREWELPNSQRDSRPIPIPVPSYNMGTPVSLSPVKNMAISFVKRRPGGLLWYRGVCEQMTSGFPSPRGDKKSEEKHKTHLTRRAVQKSREINGHLSHMQQAAENKEQVLLSTDEALNTDRASIAYKHHTEQLCAN